MTPTDTKALTPSSLADDEDARGFTPSDYAHTAELLRSSEAIRKAAASNNHNIILAALDRCAGAQPPTARGAREAFDLRAFSADNLARCESPLGFNHALSSWSLSDWMTATLGELGEAANVLKKLNRVRDGITGNKETPEELRGMFADELADAFIYLDLLAQAAGIDFPAAIRSKFERTSQKIGYGPSPQTGGGK